MKIKNLVISVALLYVLNGGVQLAHSETVNSNYTESMPITDLSMISRPQGVKCGEFFDANIVINGIPCYGYVVKEDECLIDISRKVCNRLYHLEGWDIHAEKWVDLFELNNMKNDIVCKGMIIVVPKTAELMLTLHTELQESGRANEIKRLVKLQEQARKQNKQQVSADYVIGILNSFYGYNGLLYNETGKYTNVDKKFAEKYFKLLGFDEDYYMVDGSDYWPRESLGLFEPGFPSIEAVESVELEKEKIKNK